MLSILLVSGKLISLTPETFDEYIGRDKPALVKFFAPWCGHCKAMKEDYEKLGSAYESDVVIAEVDADKYKKLGEAYGVTGFPTLKFFEKNSLKAKDYEGGRSLDELKAFVKKKTGKGANIRESKSFVLALGDSNFKDYVNGEKHVFVEFYAPW